METCTAPNSEAAKRYVQTVKAPNLSGRRDLEVILKDSQGKELWRGTYIGPGA